MIVVLLDHAAGGAVSFGLLGVDPLEPGCAGESGGRGKGIESLALAAKRIGQSTPEGLNRPCLSMKRFGVGG